MKTWKLKLKGVTIFRDGCKRRGVLIQEKPKKKKFICSECGNEQMENAGGCSVCLKCGYSGCN